MWRLPILLLQNHVHHQDSDHILHQQGLFTVQVKASVLSLILDLLAEC